MSQENVETVQRIFEAWNRNDFDAWIQYFDPEVEWSALLEEFRGHAGIRQAWQSFKVDLQLKARYEDIRDLGDSVLALGELTGTGRITGLNLNDEIAQLATFRDGRILSFRDFASQPKPSKPWGCGRRRCRRRTSSCFGECRKPGIAATSRLPRTLTPTSTSSRCRC